MDVSVSNVTSAAMLSNQLVLGYEYRVEIFSCVENDSCALEFAIDSEEQSFGGLLSFSSNGNYLLVGAPDMVDNGVVFLYKKSNSSSAWGLINRLANPSSSVSVSQFLTNILLPQIKTIVGNGMPGYGGDSGAATSTSLLFPTSIAVDSSGNIYIADTQNHRIRKFTALTGKLSTIAGTEEEGYNGDNIIATTAKLSSPTGVALDSIGNVYIADSQNHRIRKITISNGKISTIAGDGDAGSPLYDGLSAIASSLNNPTSVAVDQSSSNTVYFADTNNSKIRKITSSKLYTVAGTDYTYSPYIQPNLIYEGLAQYIKISSPISVAASGGKIYFIENLINTVRQVVVQNGYYTMTTIAGGCRPGFPSTTEFACLDSPFGIAIGPNGDVYVADKSNARIKKINPTTKTISTIAGGSGAGFDGDNGPAILSSLNDPCGIAVQSNGAVYIADTKNNRIRKVL
ncbi:NHL repeat-containing protein [Naegleria gruberi]|uniref:NHL repeat-containing protein n=1 Tax=Naegleria gruberi TaxID=5762 RepID=D2VQN6_NAEGR|nr:NHL repeat-containing protein [Naegleria gruberi]EFC40980.1 NHL repeat-containing protein [Naegleria gruberi]|eukprot:XP_002673724.1 NHL repeat-containing protein [Naegleria gruberi strain NEG-M]